MSLSVILISSTGLSPVSFEMLIAVLSFRGEFTMISFMCCSCGIFGIFAGSWYFGFIHVKLKCFT